MTIKKGYNDKTTTINIHAPSSEEGREAEVWITQEGLTKDKETLSYITIDELLNLKTEIDTALKSITRIY